MGIKYGDITPRLGAHAEKELLDHADPVLVLAKLGLNKSLPKNKGENLKLRRPVPLPVPTSPLVEGVQPTANTFSYEDVTIVLQEWGDWVAITNKITDLHEDEVGKDIAMMMGEQAALTLENIIWGKVRGGTNLIRTNGSARTDINTVFKLGHIRQAVRTLKAQKAKMYTNVLSGSTMYSTRPIEAAYVAVCHTDLDPHIRNLPGFISVAEYGQRKVICAQELGSVENVRFITSPELTGWDDAGGIAGAMLSASGSKANVLPILIMGKGAFACTALKGSKHDGGAIKPKVRNPGTPLPGDELGRTGSVSWVTWFAAAILNQNWIVRIESAAEENPAEPS